MRTLYVLAFAVIIAQVWLVSKQDWGREILFPRIVRPDVLSVADKGLSAWPFAQPAATGPARKIDQAHRLPVTQKARLQDALDRYRVLRLDPGDYQSGGVAALHLRSGQQLYGLPGTQIPKVIVDGGTRDARLSTVITPAIEFPPSPKVTRDNRFERIMGNITVHDARLENNTFLDIDNTQIDVDTRHGGYLKGNRFIRIMSHGASPAIRLRGDTGRRSGGNVFLWTNLLTPQGDSIYVDNQADLNFIGLDAESWNWDRRATQPAMMTTGPMGTLRVIMANGGQNLPDDHKTGIFDIDADRFELLGLSVGDARQPGITLQPGNKAAVLINTGPWQVKRESRHGALLSAFPGNGELHAPQAAASLALRKTSLLDGLFAALPPALGVAPPLLKPVADPAGPDWKHKRARERDSSAYIQHLVDAQGIARLPAGVYYISRPIRLKKGQGIVGAGEDKTAIVAKRPNIDLIVGDDHLKERYGGTTFALADLTLQGGRNGIHHDPDGAGGGAQFNLVYLSHVTFRDMRNAGIFIDRIMAWDNNFLDHLTFYRNGAGIKQRVDPFWLHGDNPGMSYLDKNVCYRCRFIDNERGLDLKARRQNNLNACIGCLFENNRRFAADLENNHATLFVSSAFINNGGDPVVRDNQSTLFIGSYFRAGARGRSMVGNGATVEACRFERGGNRHATVVAGPGRVFFFNSSAPDMPLGRIRDGVFANNALLSTLPLRDALVMIRNGKVQALLSDSKSQVLADQ